MIEQLKIYDVKSSKVRLGNPWDGGYVLPELMINESSALFSYGVGTDISFEIDYVRRTNKPSYSFDHTVDSAHIPEDLANMMVFKKEGIWYQKEDNLDTFFNHYEQSNLTNLVLLKIDIEGAEFPIFSNTDIERLSKIVTGIILEFHPIESNEKLQEYFDILKKLNQYFYHCHFHGNNYGGAVEVTDYDITFKLPHILEMTFISKSLVHKFFSEDEIKLDMNDFPTEHDKKNDLNRIDHSLEFLKAVNNL